MLRTKGEEARDHGGRKVPGRPQGFIYAQRGRGSARGPGGSIWAQGSALRIALLASATGL